METILARAALHWLRMRRRHGFLANRRFVRRISPAPSHSTHRLRSALFPFTQNGVVVARAAVPTILPGVAFRSYVEVNSAAGIPGAIQSGIAISNNSSTSATVNFELTGLDGFNTGLTASVVVPASGHVSKFIHEL